MNIESYFKITYGLYLVTSEAKGQKTGYVANTVFQVTANPPQFGISCNKENYSYQIISESGAFAFSILGEKASAGLIGEFGYRSGRELDKFKGVNYFAGPSGSPVVTDSSIAWFDCRVVQTIDVGSHVLFIGEALDNGVIDAETKPLTYAYYREVLKGFSPKNAPTYIDKEKIAPKDEVSTDNEVWQCQLCRYTYETDKGDPISGIPPGTRFEDLPDDWTCPICGADKLMFDRD